MSTNSKKILIIVLLFMLSFVLQFNNECFAYTTDSIFENKTIIIAAEPSTSTDSEDTSTSGEVPSSSEEEGGVSIILMLKESVAKWYYVFREISIIVMLLVFIYLGIMMAISSIASDKAKYKTMLLDWFVGFSLVFFIHYYMLGIISINEVLVEDFIPHLTLTEFAKKNNLEEADIKSKDVEYLSDTQKEEDEEEKTYSDAEVKIYETLRSRAYEIKASRAIVGTIMYALMVYLAVRFSIIYFVRLITIMILTVIAPFIALAYAIQKIMNGKSTIYSNWMREYAFTVLIQAIHAFIYVVFISAVLLMIDDTLAGIAVSFIVLLSMIRADELVRALFPKQMPKESSLEENSKMNINEKTKQVRGWGKSANRFVQGRVKPHLVNGVANVANINAANNMSYFQASVNDDDYNNDESSENLSTSVTGVDMSYQNQAEEATEDLEDVIDNASESDGNLENSRTATGKNVNEEIDDRIEKLEEQKKEQKNGIALLQNETSKLQVNSMDSQMAMPMLALYMNGKNTNVKRNITGYAKNNKNSYEFKGFANAQSRKSVNPAIGNKKKRKRYMAKKVYQKTKKGRKNSIIGASGRLAGSRRMIKMNSGNMYLERTDRVGKYEFVNNIEEQIDILNESKNVSNAFFDGSMNRMREINYLSNKGNNQEANRVYQDYMRDMKTARFKLQEPMVTMALMNYLNKSNMTYAKNFNGKDIDGITVELNSIFQQNGFNGVSVGDGFAGNLLDELYQDELQMQLDDENYDYGDQGTYSGLNITVKENQLVRENYRGEFGDFYRENQSDTEEINSDLYQEKLFQLQNTINLKSQNILEDREAITINGQELRDRILQSTDKLAYAEVEERQNNINQMEKILEGRLNEDSLQNQHNKFYSMDGYEKQEDELEMMREKIKEINSDEKNSKNESAYQQMYQPQTNMKIENYMQEQDRINGESTEEQRRKESDRYRRIRENAEERYQELLGNNKESEKLQEERYVNEHDTSNDELNNRYKKIRELSENGFRKMQEKTLNNKSDIEILRDKIMNALNSIGGIEKQAVDPRNKPIIDSANQMEKINKKAKESKLREIFNIDQDFRHLMEEANNNLGGGKA